MLVETRHEGVLGTRNVGSERFQAIRPTAFILNRWSRTFGSVELERVEVRSILYKVSDSYDAVECIYVESGQASLEGTVKQELSAGTVSFLPSWTNPLVQVPAEATLLIIRVDRTALAGIVPTMPNATKVIPLRHGLMASTKSFATTAFSEKGPFSAVENYAMGQLLTEMVGSMLLDQFGFDDTALATSASKQLRDRALSVIAQRRGDPTLTVADVARAVLVSPRRLQAVFAEANTTVTAEIRQLRVALAVHLLTTVRYDVLSIEEIASQTGFGSSLSLRRALNDAHGVTPSQLRARRESFGSSRT